MDISKLHPVIVHERIAQLQHDIKYYAQLAVDANTDGFTEEYLFWFDAVRQARADLAELQYQAGIV